jgi:hypothetical protein
VASNPVYGPRPQFSMIIISNGLAARRDPVAQPQRRPALEVALKPCQDCIPGGCCISHMSEHAGLRFPVTHGASLLVRMRFCSPPVR